MIFFTIGLLIYVFSKNLLANILREFGNNETYRIKFIINSYRARMLLQFFPLVLLMGTFVYLITDAVEIEEKGDAIFNKYYSDLQNVKIKDSTSIDDVIEKLNQINKEYENDTYFIITKDEIIYQDTDEEISDFFKTYTWFYDDINRSYGYYATSIQGAYETVNIDGTDYACGVMYYAQAHKGYVLIFATILFISLCIIVFLIFFARDFSISIIKVSDYMKKLATGEFVDYNQKLPVTSSDELGDLTINFNKILDKEKQYVETIKASQEMLIENERLSSLGQLIGGIAHNLKTPIMSVSGYLVALENLAEEYKDSIGNPDVLKQDYEDITNEMKECIKKSKEYMSYMTEVINAAKGQAVSMNANNIGSFTAQELLIRTQILMKEELLKYNRKLNAKLNISETTEIQGELSAIVQVLDNLISNAMQAYGNKKGDINLTLNEDDKNVYIEVQDFAGGIPENIKDKLFKEMVTTKGKDGTGLGLYMCYSTIKGKFNGDMKFESESGVGTKFYIILNKVV